MSRKGLAELIFPMPLEKFFKTYWPQDFFVIHKDNPKLNFFKNHPTLEKVETVLESFTGKVMASLPDFNDEYSSLNLDTKDALKVYKNGMSLTFNEVQKLIPELGDWLSNIRLDLGLAEADLSKPRSLIYASPHGKGTSAHFDCNINFVLQLRGKKKWKLAPNNSVENPVIRYTTRTPVSEELARHCTKPLPHKMPSNATTVELKPGSLLFVPRGTWHETLAEGESLSLNFTFSQPTWLDIFSIGLYKTLARDPAWRALADGWGSPDPGRKEKAKVEFSKRLKSLELEKIAQVGTYSALKKYVPAKGIQYKLKNDWATIYKGRKVLLSLEVDSDVKRFLEWALHRSAAFDAEDIRSKKFFKSDTVVVNLIEGLGAAGVIKRA